MKSRPFLVAVLIVAHAAALVAAPRLPDSLVPVLAGSVYVPLMPFAALGLPVFGPAEPWGWASPSLLGWGTLLLVWTGIWWAVAFGLELAFRFRVGHSRAPCPPPSPRGRRRPLRYPPVEPP